MGKNLNNIKFKEIWSEDKTEKFVGASLVNVLENITSEQFCNLIRRSVHLSIMPCEYEYVPDYLMKEIKKDLFPSLSKQELTKVFHYWKLDSYDNTPGKTLDSFAHEYRSEKVHIGLLVGFEKEGRKLVAYTEWSTTYNYHEYKAYTLMELIYQIHKAVDENIELYEKLKAKYEPQSKLEKQDDGLWSHNAIEASDELVERIRKAPTMTMEELERACEEYELQPDGTYDDI